MFGKTEKNKQPLPDIKITKIPDDFYAGTNPIVKFQTIEKVIKPVQKDKAVLSSTDKKILDKKTAVGAGNKLHPINLFTNWKFLIIGSLFILIFGGSVFGLYYWWQYRKALPSVSEPAKPTVTESVTQPLTTTPESTSTVAVEPTSTTPVVIAEAKLDFPSPLLGDSVDTDKDDISDVAEELFGTDSSVPDSDGDKFTDGHEVYYLYNPAGKEPLKLVDSGLISVYDNPAYLYKTYFPKSWAVGNVDPGYKDVLFSTLTGENVEIRVMSMNPGESFNDWFARNANGEQLADYLPFESVFKESGFARKDSLVYFFPKGDQVFVILYHTTDSTIINYRIVIKMMARSFQFGSTVDIPARPIEESQSVINATSTISAPVTTSAVSSPNIPL